MDYVRVRVCGDSSLFVPACLRRATAADLLREVVAASNPARLSECPPALDGSGNRDGQCPSPWAREALSPETLAADLRLLRLTDDNRLVPLGGAAGSADSSTSDAPPMLGAPTMGDPKYDLAPHPGNIPESGGCDAAHRTLADLGVPSGALLLLQRRDACGEWHALASPNAA